MASLYFYDVFYQPLFNVDLINLDLEHSVDLYRRENCEESSVTTSKVASACWAGYCF